MQHPDRPVGKAPRVESRQQRKHHRRGQIHPRLGLFQPRPAVGRRALDDRSGLLHQGRQYPPRAFVGRRRLFDHHLRHGMGRQNRRGKTVGYHRFFGRKLSADHLAGCSQDAAGPDVPCPQRVHERYRDAQTLRRGYAGKRGLRTLPGVQVHFRYALQGTRGAQKGDSVGNHCQKRGQVQQHMAPRGGSLGAEGCER